MKKNAHIVILSVLAAAAFSCRSGSKTGKAELQVRRNAAETNTMIQNALLEQDKAVKKFIGAMSDAQKAAQMFIINIEGNADFIPVEKMSAIDKSSGEPLVPGGYIFFSYNIADTEEKVREFTGSIREFCISGKVIPPFLATDQEGGYVDRLGKLGETLPSQKKVAETMEIGQAYQLYSQKAEQMRRLGFHLNLAPVAEAETLENREFLGRRSFGDADTTIKYGTAAVNAYGNNGIGAVLKHFPGNTNTDPHTGLPEITADYAQLEKMIRPFAEIMRREPAGILMSHARTQALDPGVPACLSKKWISEILRGQLGYKGIVFSDDIFMGALADNGYPPEKAALMAVEAGTDCIMISEKRFAGPAKILVTQMEKDAEFRKKIDESVERIIRFKIKAGILEFRPLNDGSYIIAAAECHSRT